MLIHKVTIRLFTEIKHVHYKQMCNTDFTVHAHITRQFNTVSSHDFNTAAIHKPESDIYSGIAFNLASLH